MITEPWQDDPLLMNGKYDGCATKDNADMIMMMQGVTPTLAGEKYSGGSGMNKILCWLGIRAWQITHWHIRSVKCQLLTCKHCGELECIDDEREWV